MMFWLYNSTNLGMIRFSYLTFGDMCERPNELGSKGGGFAGRSPAQDTI